MEFTALKENFVAQLEKLEKEIDQFRLGLSEQIKNQNKKHHYK